MDNNIGNMALIITDKDNVLQCIFCKSSDLDEVNLGPMYSCENVVTHYFCMLFSAGLVQNGNSDKEGILGFLPPDIWKEVRRGNRLKCTFCNQSGASLGCCKKSCKTMYHFRCGLNNGVQYQFLKNFRTYCIEHHIPQQIVVPEDKWSCPICISVIDKDDNVIMPSCCKGAVFHKECIKRMALNAGYFFKCPMCNAKKGFITEMRLYGIFVPEQDASWEREPQAFQDHYHQYSTCDAEKCVCPKGKDFNAEKGDFEIARCNICGAAAMHKKCGNLKDVEGWNCDACSIVLKNAGLASSAPCTSTTLERQRNSGTTRRILPEIVNIAKIKLEKPAKSYFPYPKTELRKFQNEGVNVLPDYRGLILRVNMVDWIGSYVQGIENTNDSNGYNSNCSPETDPEFGPRSNTELTTGAGQISAAGVIPTRRKYVQKKRKSKSRSPRGGRWKRGVVHKRKDKKKTVNLERPAPAETQVGCGNTSFATPRVIDPQETTSVYKDEGEEKLQTDDSLLQNTTVAFSSPIPAKRRKVLELGHNIFAAGEIKDIYVQSNVVVDDTADSEIDVAMTDLSPIQEHPDQQLGSEQKTDDTGLVVEDEEMETSATSESEFEKIRHEGIFSDHSYAKNFKAVVE